MHANSTHRQMRSEAREACASLASLLMMYTDVLTLEVRIPGGPDLDFRWCAKKLGLSYGRVIAASVSLQAAGLLHLRRRYRQNPSGERFAITAVKTIDRSLFYILGLRSALVRQQTAARKRTEREKRLADRKTVDKDRTDQDCARFYNTRLYTQMVTRRLVDQTTRTAQHKPSVTKRPVPEFDFPLPLDAESADNYYHRVLKTHPATSPLAILHAYREHGDPP